MMSEGTYLGKKMPKEVRVVEVAPRDGLQNLERYVPTETKKELILKLAKAGMKEMEVTSFVHPKAIPQMSDASEIASFSVQCGKELGFLPTALVPNLRGAQNAWESGIRTVNYVISVSRTHNKENINRTHEESLKELQSIRETFPELHLNVALATAFGCPFEGEVTLDQTLNLIEKVLPYRIGIVTLSDTIGVAIPQQVQEVIQGVKDRFEEVSLGLHVHDTHGRGLMNVWSAMALDITRIECAAGGLGGCPFAPGAAGNLGTEDLVSLLERSGIQTEIRLDLLLDAIMLIREKIEGNLLSHLSKSRSYAELSFFTLK